MSDEFDDFSAQKYGRAGDSRPPEIDSEAKRARKEYERLAATDDLDKTTDDEAQFLAKMYVCAEHFGVLKKYKTLIEDAMMVRPDKVKAAARVFDAVSLIYRDSGEYADSYRGDLERGGHLDGKAAESYYAEFDTIIKHLHTGGDNLRQLAASTADLLDKFGDALIDWRKGIAEAIRKMAEQERDREFAALKGITVGVFTKDPYEAAGKTLDSLLELWYKTDKDAKASDSTLRKFASERGFKLDDAKHGNVDYHGLVLTDPFDGSFT